MRTLRENLEATVSFLPGHGYPRGQSLPAVRITSRSSAASTLSKVRAGCPSALLDLGNNGLLTPDFCRGQIESTRTVFSGGSHSQLESRAISQARRAPNADSFDDRSFWRFMFIPYRINTGISVLWINNFVQYGIIQLGNSILKTSRTPRPRLNLFGPCQGLRGHTALQDGDAQRNLRARWRTHRCWCNRQASLSIWSTMRITRRTRSAWPWGSSAYVILAPKNGEGGIGTVTTQAPRPMGAASKARPAMSLPTAMALPSG